MLNQAELSSDTNGLALELGLNCQQDFESLVSMSEDGYPDFEEIAAGISIHSTESVSITPAEDRDDLNTLGDVSASLSPSEFAKLKIFKISRFRFNQEFPQLCALGFSADIAKKFILRRSSMITVTAVINYTRRLEAAPYRFSLEDIAQISCQNGGAKNIEALLSSFLTLKDFGFSHPQMIKIVGHNGGGAKRINKILESYEACAKLGIEHEKMIELLNVNHELSHIRDAYLGAEALANLSHPPSPTNPQVSTIATHAIPHISTTAATLFAKEFVKDLIEENPRKTKRHCA